MTQSVELLLDAETDAAVRAEWDLLRHAGLPSAWRPEPSGSHRPHVTLLARAALDEAVEPGLHDLVHGLDLSVVLGSPLVFSAGRRGVVSFILVRQVIASAELLGLQTAVRTLCGPGLDATFDPGRWVPHVTLGRRFAADQLGPALELLSAQPATAEREVRITACRRWDGTARRDWLL